MMVTKEIQTGGGIIYITLNGRVHSIQAALLVGCDKGGDTEVAVQTLRGPVYAELLQTIGL
jgi:microcompartment protein CcmL/EutN